MLFLWAWENVEVWGSGPPIVHVAVAHYDASSSEAARYTPLPPIWHHPNKHIPKHISREPAYGPYTHIPEHLGKLLWAIKKEQTLTGRKLTTESARHCPLSHLHDGGGGASGYLPCPSQGPLTGLQVTFTEEGFRRRPVKWKSPVRITTREPVGCSAQCERRGLLTTRHG